MQKKNLLGTYIAKKRELRSWTQQELADNAKITVRTVQRMEAGRRPAADSLKGIGNALGIAPEELVRVASQEPDLTPSAPAAAADGPPLDWISSGTNLATLVAGAFAHSFGHPELDGEAEADLIGGFLDGCVDWGDVWSDLSQRDRIRATQDLAGQIRALAAAGFLVFGARRPEIVHGTRMPVMFLRILRSDDPEVPFAEHAQETLDEVRSMLAQARSEVGPDGDVQARALEILDERMSSSAESTPDSEAS